MCILNGSHLVMRMVLAVLKTCGVASVEAQTDVNTPQTKYSQLMTDGPWCG